MDGTVNCYRRCLDELREHAQKALHNAPDRETLPGSVIDFVDNMLGEGTK